MTKTSFTSPFVRRYINRLSPNTIFSTQEVLQYGTRAAIDKALSRLVKNGHIIRIARGLFRKEDYDVPLPPIIEIAKFKAQAFNKEIFTKDVNTEAISDLESTFLTNGRSSSLRYGNTFIRLKGISPKKLDRLKP